MKNTSLSSQQIKRSTVSIFFFFCIILSASMILYSCSDNSTDPDLNPNGSGNGNGGGTSNATSPTFDNVGQILIAACGDCHGSERQESGVRLDTYNHVINSVGVQYGEKIVNPGSAETSPLIEKIEANPEKGDRMPKGRTPLSIERIIQISTWINNGANEDVSEGNNNDGGY